MEQWTLIDVDFSAIYHLELDDNLHRSFRWWLTKVGGLFGHPSSLLRAHFRPDDTNPGGE